MADKSLANITNYMQWLSLTKGIHFPGYHELWNWSVTDLGPFWISLIDYFNINLHSKWDTPLSQRNMPGVKWFPGSRLNYVEQAIQGQDEDIAVIFWSELKPLETITYKELRQEVKSVAQGLRELGVVKGDRVAAYMANVPQALIMFLATASLGAIWSACAPEFGTRSVIERFKQIEPKVLVAVDGYRYGGKDYSRIDEVQRIQMAIPSILLTVLVPNMNLDNGEIHLDNTISWTDIHRSGVDFKVEPVDFEHPLWILYTSGTTGPPKPIVQGHGGILLEHLKVLSLHFDLKRNDRFFWITNTGWMMWNLLIGGLLVDASVLLYDGSPTYPNLGGLWAFFEEAQGTYFGASAPYIQVCMKRGLSPQKTFDTGRIRGLGSTGAPLSPEGFKWVYENVSPELLLNSFSGGTDLCTGFLGSSPILPVHAGEISSPLLGAKIESFDQAGNSLVGQVGELVITEPMPSMPLFLWNDATGKLLFESYFQQYEGVWRHGDWIKITERNSCVIYGRSDSTLNRGGVRMGTSEFYRITEEIKEISDSMILDTGFLNQEGELLLFVVLDRNISLTEDLISQIKSAIRVNLSPRYVPDMIYEVFGIPKTLNGKKLEVPVRHILNGIPSQEVVDRDAVINPESLEFFIKLADNRAANQS